MHNQQETRRLRPRNRQRPSGHKMCDHTFMRVDRKLNRSEKVHCCLLAGHTGNHTYRSHEVRT